MTLRAAAFEVGTIACSVSLPPERYSCVGDSLIQSPAQRGVSFRAEFRRVGK